MEVVEVVSSMKKNVVFILMILILILSLSSCGNNKTSKDTSYLILNVTINPSFDLYLDESMNIIRVTYNNTDAQTLFEEIDVVNMSYEEGFALILDTAMEKEFISEENKDIQIDIVSQEEISEDKFVEIKQVVDRPIETFEEENRIDISVTEPELTNQLVRNGKLYDEKGNHVADMVLYYDENKNCTKEVCNFFSGDITVDIYQYSESGKKIYWKCEGTNCLETEEWYDENGNRTKRIDKEESKSYYVEWTYHKNGKPATCYSLEQDGTYSTKTYDENGTVISTVSANYEEGYYEEDGEIRRYIIDKNGDSRIEVHYYKSGNMYKYMEESDEVHVVREYYDKAGTNAEKYSITVKADGSKSERRYNEGGKLVYEYQLSTRQEILYENGKLLKYVEDGREVTDERELELIKMALGF